MDDLGLYPDGQWIKLDIKRDLNSDSVSSEAEAEERAERILRGPIWNYGKKLKGEKMYYDELLFGKQKNKVFTPNELILKGPPWAPAKPVKYSFAKYLLKKMRKVDPDSTALTEVETGRSLNYRQLVETSQSVACGLRWAGVLPGQVVAVVSFNSLEAYQVILGAILAGAIPATVDSTLNPEDLRELLRVIRPSMVFTEGGKTVLKVEVALSHLLTPGKPAVVVSSRSKTHPHLTFQQLLREVDADFQPANLMYNPNNPILILFTSGTSGTAKAAVMAENMYMNNRIFIHSVFSDSSSPYTALNSGPCFWTTMVGSIFIHLSVGNRVVFFRGPPSTTVLCASLRKFNALVWISGPASLMQMLNWSTKPRCTNLRTVYFTGMPLLKSNIFRLENEVFEGKVHVLQLYGMTEIGAVTTNSSFTNKLGSVGKVFFNIQMKVVDETGLALGPNEEGEICLRSSTMMLGYYNNPEATEACFDEEGFFSTGDIGYYDDEEFVYITGRKKDLIKWMSYQVAPADVEAKLLAHHAVKEALVVGLPHDTAGELVAAAITLNPGYEDTEPELLQQVVNDCLSPARQIRGGIHLFSSLPLTTTGKPLRRTVVKMILHRKYDPLDTIYN